nr:MFS transporter [Promicromonospora thailandica]
MIWVFMLVNVVLNGAMTAITLHLVQIGTAPALVGLVSTAVGIGVLAGAVLAGVLVKRVRVGALTALTIGMFGLALAVMAVLPTFWGFVGALTGAMLFAPALNAGMLAYVTAITPGHLQGRMSATMGLTSLVAGPAAPLVGSLLLAHLGIGPALGVLAGVWACLFVALFLVRPLWRIGLPDTWEHDVVEWTAAA